MMQFITKNFWLKVSALFLAVIVWLYVVGELNKGTPEEKNLFEQMLPAKLSAKEVPIKISLTGRPPAGYRVLGDSISIKPAACVIIGPKGLLKNISCVMTERIDTSEFTKSIAKEVKIKPLGAGIALENDLYVYVVIPIQKIEREGETR
jgi:YbbR domain-containing protein